MYKTTYELHLMVRAGEDLYPFDGAAAATALNQVKACRDIDVILTDPDNPDITVIVPYHAIDFVAVNVDRSEEEDPVDENLKNCSGGGDGGDTGILKIINKTDTPIEDTPVYLCGIEPGVYGGIEFETTEWHPAGCRSAVWAEISIGSHSSFTISGIPTGTAYSVISADDGSSEGNIPGTAVFTDVK